MSKTHPAGQCKNYFPKRFPKIILDLICGLIESWRMSKKKHTKTLSNLAISAGLRSRSLFFVKTTAEQKRVLEAIKWLGIDAGTAAISGGGFSIRYGNGSAK